MPRRPRLRPRLTALLLSLGMLAPLACRAGEKPDAAAEAGESAAPAPTTPVRDADRPGEPAESAAPAGEPIPRERIDTILGDLFGKHRDLERFSADVVRTRSGGIFRQPVRRAGTVRAELPGLFRLDFSEDGLLLLVDGTYAWELDTEFDEADRYTLAKLDGEGGGIRFDLAGLLLGADVATVEELHRLYDVSATGRDGVFHFNLIPTAGDVAETYQRASFELAEDAVLPRRAEVVRRAPETSDRPPASTVFEFSNVRTNFDDLEPFRPETFLFPATEQTYVQDRTAEGGAREIPAPELAQDLVAVKRSVIERLAAEEAEGAGAGEETNR